MVDKVFTWRAFHTASYLGVILTLGLAGHAILGSGLRADPGITIHKHIF